MLPSTNDAGTGRSTPKGLSPTLSRIQWIADRSSSSVMSPAPRMPIPPALLTAATTSSVWFKADDRDLAAVLVAKPGVQWVSHGGSLL